MTLLLLHGFMGTGADWDAVRAEMDEADGLRVLVPDLPGHGEMVGLSLDAYTIDAAADTLAERLGDGPAVVAGYSMGGRLALHLALRHPDRVGALVLVSASPGLRTEGARAARRRLDAERAASIRADFSTFLDAWYRAPIWGGLDDDLRQRLARRRLGNDPVELRASLEGMGTGAQPSHWDDLARLRCPTWALAGERDQKYVSIACDMAEASPIKLVLVPDAGHALLDEAPRVVASVLVDALGSNVRHVAFPPPTLS